MADEITMASRINGEIKETDQGYVMVSGKILSLDAVPNLNNRIYSSDTKITFDGKPVYDNISTGPSDKKNVITPEAFARKMREISNIKDSDGYQDSEVCHERGDNLMMELLSSLGYSEGVNIFDQMDKYYS